MRCAKYLPPLGPFDVIFLSTLGVGAVAWIARSTLFGKSNRSSSSPKPPENAPSTKQSSLSERNFVKVMQEQGRRVIFFYGSQTGTAEDYASRLAKECSQRYGVSCMAADLEQYDLSYLDTVPEDNLVVFVMATYGEGEPTDNAVETWELITGEAPDFSQGARLEGLRYMIFGLGNKTYEHYNAVCRTMDARLQELGATRIGERGEGDDDASLEEDFLSWQESMWPAFCSALGVDESSAQSGPRQPVFAVKELTTYDEAKVYFGELAEWLKENEEIVYDAKRPYFAPAETRDLFRDTDRHCLHVEIDISRTNLTYQTGDHVAIWPTNSEAQVERLASILGLIDKLDTVVTVDAIDSAASKKHPFPVPTTYRAIFRHYLDICAPASRQTLMSLVEYAPTEASKAKLQTLASNKDEYHEKVSDAVRNLAEVLEMCQDEPRTGFFNSVPFDLVVESVPRLQPRYYSISSSSYIHPHTVVATAVTLKYNPTPDRTVYGVATNYLWKIHAAAHGLPDEPGQPDYDLLGPRGALEGRKIPVHIRRSQFKLPRNPSSPVIMIGPGTGVAPFRGFVHERAAMKRDGKPVGPTVLFYGCRHPDQDFLYADEWDALFQTLGEGSRIITAFSRYTEQKVYVQHKLQEHGEAMWALIEKGAYIYVCGDAKNMARDVQRTFVNLAQSVGGKTEKQAQDFIKRLRNTGRYLEDVWS